MVGVVLATSNIRPCIKSEENEQRKMETEHLAFCVYLSRWASWGSSDARRFRDLVRDKTRQDATLTSFLI